jgi:ABC-type uncharacterized transport system substrate-binding protein
MFDISRKNIGTLFLLILILVGSGTSVYIMATFKGESFKPALNKGKKWKLAYYEGGPHKIYVAILTGFLDGLVEKGWAKKPDKSTIPKEVFSENNSKLLWKWFGENVVSDYVEFPLDNYWSPGWPPGTRSDSKFMVESAWKAKAFDAIVAMGARPGQDLVSVEHKFPILLVGVTDPVEAKITKSDTTSGYSNVFAIFDPDRIDRCIKISHEILKFKSIGFVVGSHEGSELSSGANIISRLANEIGCKPVKCIVNTMLSDQQRVTEETVECVKKMANAKEIDVFIFTHLVGVPLETVPLILRELNTHKIPSLSIDSALVEQGVFLSYGMVGAYNEKLGGLAAEAAIKIFRGAKPGDIKNTYEKIQRGLSLNMKTADVLGIRIPASMIQSAVKIYP